MLDADGAMSESSSGGFGCWAALAVVAVGSYVGWEYTKSRQAVGEWMLGRDCPFGAELAGDHPPRGVEEWCQEEVNESYVRHGAYRTWYPDGRLRVRGWFVHGVHANHWSAFRADGDLDMPETKRLNAAVGERPAKAKEDEVSVLINQCSRLVLRSFPGLAGCEAAKQTGLVCLVQSAVWCDGLAEPDVSKSSCFADEPTCKAYARKTFGECGRVPLGTKDAAAAPEASP